MSSRAVGPAPKWVGGSTSRLLKRVFQHRSCIGHGFRTGIVVEQMGGTDGISGGTTAAPPPIGTYVADDDETPGQIAAQLGVSLSRVLDLNRPRYGKHFKKTARLMQGTNVLVPLNRIKGPWWAGQTEREIAKFSRSWRQKCSPG